MSWEDPDCISACSRRPGESSLCGPVPHPHAAVPAKQAGPHRLLIMRAAIDHAAKGEVCSLSLSLSLTGVLRDHQAL